MKLLSMIPLFLLLFFLVFIIIGMVLEKQKNKKFKMHQLINKNKRKKEDTSLLYEIFWPILKLRKNWLPKRTEEKLREELKKANWNQQPIEFVLSKIVISVFVFSIFILEALIFPHFKNVILVFGLGFAIMAYFHRNYSLKSAIKARRFRLELELPEFMLPLAYMMKKYPTYEATKRSVEYAPANIKPLVEELVTKIDLEPDSFEPYLDFAKKTEVPLAHQFMSAVQQARETDEQKSAKILDNQIELMRKLRAESYLHLANTRPGLVSKYIGISYLGMIVLVLGLSFTALFSKFVNLF